MTQLASRFSKLVATHPRIILGTASSSRRAIMDSLAEKYAFRYEVLKADIDEKAIRHDEPRQLVMSLAHAKADTLMQQLQEESKGAGDGRPATFLITCDQVVVHDGQIREKPEDIAEVHRYSKAHPVSGTSQMSYTQ
eukprot:GHUV01003818.1.p1 GENE.GHUV01003818.1~~GHUV01003818.1.p1  ORF type:complete len:137 (+),score=10.67 GHUV01003818.1:628-1038(+)